MELSNKAENDQTFYNVILKQNILKPDPWKTMWTMGAYWD